jgi:YVTN family beta-propeller protein
MQGVHGVALAPEFSRGFVSSGRDNTVRVIDLKTLKETSQIATGKKPDAILYDAPSKKVFAFCGGSNSATVIDAESAKVAGEIQLGGAPEFGVSDGKGKVFVNLEDKAEVVAIDVATLKAVAHWSLAPGAGPTGLAIDVDHHRLFSGCGESKTMVVLDSENGKIVASLPIGVRCDATGFDPKSQHAFSSNGDGTLTVIHEENPNTFSVIQNLKTQPGARTMAIDSKTHKIWLVTAEMKDAPDDKVEQNRQHKVVAPDTFTAITVGR